jgi:hypothetical protein
MVAKGRKPERVGENPYEQMLEIAESAGLNQIRVQLQRRGENGNLKNVKFFHLPLESLSNIEEIVQQRWGGGHFEAQIQHPADFKQRYFTYIFDGEGLPLEDGKPGATGPGAVMWDGTQWVSSGASAQQNAPAQSMHPYPYPPPPGVPIHPMTGAPVYHGYNPYSPYPPSPYPSQPSGPSPNEERMRSEIDALKSALAQSSAQAMEERRRWEERDREEKLRREIDDIRRKAEEQDRLIFQKLETVGKSEESSTFQLLMKMQENSQTMYDRMSVRELEQGRLQLEQIKTQAESDLQFRKQTMEMLQAMQDPGKSLDFFNRLGEQTASTLGLMLQLAESGIFGGKEEGNPVIDTVKQAISGLQQFGTEWIQSQQDRQTIVASQARNFAGLPQRLPAQGQQRPQPPQGQPRPAAPPQQQAPVPRPPAPPAGGDLPETMKKPLTAIGRAMMMRDNPQIVGEMIFNLADHHRYFRMLPETWTGIFTDPKTVIISILKQHAPMVQFSPEDPYLDTVAQAVLAAEEALQADLAAMRDEMEEDGADLPPGVIGASGPHLSVIEVQAEEEEAIPDTEEPPEVEAPEEPPVEEPPVEEKPKGKGRQPR